jgi:hypothetical protein
MQSFGDLFEAKIAHLDSRRHAEALAEASQAAYPDSVLQPLAMS